MTTVTESRADLEFQVDLLTEKLDTMLRKYKFEVHDLASEVLKDHLTDHPGPAQFCAHARCVQADYVIRMPETQR